MIADCDLVGADAQVVAWEAEDEDLKAAFRAGLKIHAKNARDLFGDEAGPDGKKEPYYHDTKQLVHATNYDGKAKGIAAVLGWPVGRVVKFQRKWFQLHPGIKRWQNRVDMDLQKTRTVWNKFGYRIVYFDYPENLLAKGLAWCPQSTVALTCIKGALKVRATLPWVQILLQVHDSLVLQYPIEMHERRLEIKKALEVVIPYDDPLTIPWGLAVSTKSWGDVEDCAW